jgi:Heterokaryon incompatibility protein (HET)
MVQLQHVIDVAGLPQVFQDTIQIAYHLGIKHLWIDALCIIQDEDDHSDWENESQNMDKIYSCAFLNVSATVSLDGSESLSKERSWGPFLLSEVELEVNGLFQKYYVLDGDMWDDEISNAPLNKRGWVFQERFLARRVLHFGERQLGWECRELDALEMFPEGLPRASLLGSMTKSKVVSMMATLAQQSDQTPDLKFVDLWQNLVKHYSKCTLTYSKDKLIAFAGVAKWMMEARTDGYAAGMWEKGMVYDLAWWRLSEDREVFPISETSLRAPSWSWASVDGEITFPSTFGGVQAHFVDILESSEPITNESCVFATRESIRTKGYCLLLGIECSNEGIVGFKVSGIRFPVSDGARDSSIDLEISEEEVLELVRRGKVLFLPLFATSYFLYGIVLTKIRGICAHRRLGAVQIPVMVTDEPKEMDEEGDHNSQPSRSQPGAWVKEQSTSQSSPINKVWSIAAVNLMNYLLNPQRIRRIIDIY